MISHCSNNYGPYQMPEKLIPVTILAALEGRPVPVYGDGKNVRDWLHVEDHARALEMIVREGEPGQVYNVGANAEATNIDMVRARLRLDGPTSCPTVPIVRMPISSLSSRIGRDMTVAMPSIPAACGRNSDGGRRLICMRVSGVRFAGISRTVGGGRGSAMAASRIAGVRAGQTGKSSRCA